MIMNPTHFCFHNPQWTSVGFIIKKKTVTTIVFLSIRKELKEKILSESGAWPFAYSEPRISLDLCALRNGFPFPFKLNGMWSWRQFSFRFYKLHSFPFDFEANEIRFRSKSKGKLSPQSYPFQFERKWKHSFLSVAVCRYKHAWMVICIQDTFSSIHTPYLQITS